MDSTPAEQVPVSMPLFPLGTVLFPEGVLPLRIFERRYLDMVRECAAGSQPFGVCLISRGAEVGAPAEHHRIGCTARIVDFDMESGGVLRLRTVGGERFEVLDEYRQTDGLLRGSVRLIDGDPPLPVPTALQSCSQLMRRVIEDVCRAEPDPLQRILAEPFRPDEAGWVANRLCELLPISPVVRQSLMVLNDPVERLTRIAAVLSHTGTSS